MMSDDLLTPDQQLLVAARVRVAERLEELREILRTHPDHDPAKVVCERALRAAIAELEPLAKMLGG